MAWTEPIYSSTVLTVTAQCTAKKSIAVGDTVLVYEESKHKESYLNFFIKNVIYSINSKVIHGSDVIIITYKYFGIAIHNPTNTSIFSTPYSLLTLKN